MAFASLFPGADLLTAGLTADRRSPLRAGKQLKSAILSVRMIVKRGCGRLKADPVQAMM
jgi:hypothetical protein